tara:strand:+ start:2035 stop:2157 length:123 start_codon:yes stop_codon:yes gene_type:complete
MLDFLVLIDIITFWKKILLFKRTARQVDKRTRGQEDRRNP